MANAHSPAEMLIQLLPEWWQRNQDWVVITYRVDHLDQEEQRLEAEAAAEEERRSREAEAAYAERRRKLAADLEAVKTFQRDIDDLVLRFNDGYGDIFDFAQLLREGYTRVEIEADLMNQRDRAAQWNVRGKSPHQWREHSGGTDGVRRRLGPREAGAIQERIRDIKTRPSCRVDDIRDAGRPAAPASTRRRPTTRRR